MALDPALEEALHAAVKNAGQAEPVAQRLIAWIKALSAGESSEEQDLSFYDHVMTALVSGDANDAD